MARIEDEEGAKDASAEIAAEAEAAPDLTAAAVDVIPPEIVAQSLSQYLKAWSVRARSGDAGVLPVAIGLMVVTIAFWIVSPDHLFLSPGNLVYLFIQSSVFIVLAMAEGFVLLLGEIDLSAGYVAAIGGIIAAEMVQPNSLLPWWLPAIGAGLACVGIVAILLMRRGMYLRSWLAAVAVVLAGTGLGTALFGAWVVAIAVALLACAGIGAIQGIIITRLGVPSFVVTLAGYLFWFGVMIILLGSAGAVGIGSIVLHDQQVLFGIVNNNIDPVISWIGLAVIVGLLGSSMWLRDAGRRRSGLVAPPVGLTAMKIAVIAVAGIVVVAICNVNRGPYKPVEGVPWVFPLVLGLLAVWTMLLERTQFGRHMYAVGGNAEAARRAGISVSGIRIAAFILCSLTAGVAGVIYASQIGGVTTNINGGQLVLYAVAAAVIGGTSLFGGRGRAIHGLLGGLVIGAIYNGLYLLGLQIQWQYIATGLVLLAAVTVDSLSRKGAGSGSLARV
jgi:D-xylose transport system permease protein